MSVFYFSICKADFDYLKFQCLGRGKSEYQKVVVIGKVLKLEHHNRNGTNILSSKGYLGTDLEIENSKLIWNSRKTKKIEEHFKVPFICNSLNTPNSCPHAFDELPEFPILKHEYVFFLSKNSKNKWNVLGFEELTDGPENWAFKAIKQLNWEGCAKNDLPAQPKHK